MRAKSLLTRHFLLLSIFVSGLFAQTNVLTQHNDIGRTGQNTTETILNQANVNVNSFGLQFALNVDGLIYGQPLYMSSLNIGGTTHRVVFVVTENDSAYAFDAATGAQLWMASMLTAAHGATAGATTDPVSETGCTGIEQVGGNGNYNSAQYGITGTPVIDSSSGTMYLVSDTLENGYPVQRLHALDITTGNEKFGGPVVISASVPGTGAGSSNGVMSFDPKWEFQRPGLLELNGNIYIGFGSHCDFSTWHGWILSYNATTLTQNFAFLTTPNGTASGVWMSGAGLAADVENNVARIFPVTGNGTYDATTPYGTNTMDYGDDILNLNVSSTGGLTVVDGFTSMNQAAYAAADEDVGSAGDVILPDQPGPYPHLLAQVGKSGMLYIANRDNLGGYNATKDNVLQEVPIAAGLYGGMAYWNSNLYVWPQKSSLSRYTLTNGVLSNAPSETSPQVQNGSVDYAYGTTPSISANGNQAGTGIVWSVDFSLTPQVLYAHNANNVSQLLWSSAQNASRDGFTLGVKYVVPTIADGKVFVGGVNQLFVYGLLLPPQSITFGPIANQSVNTSVTLSAIASSGLPVTFSSANPSVCTVSGNTVTLVSAGTCSITASQPGNSSYAPAGSITQNFVVTPDSVSIGQTQALSFAFTVPSGVTLGTPVVFTEGVPSSSLASPDFTLSSGTCTNAASGTCTVTVQFTPQYVGLRRGAIKFVDNNNNLLSTSYIFGVGTGSQPAWSAGNSKAVYSGYPHGATVDGAGNVFVLDTVASKVYKITPGGTPTALTLGTTLNQPYALALDAGGNLYIADSGNNRILKLPYGSSTATALNVSNLAYPEGIAVDGSGNVFIANTKGAATSGAGTIIEFSQNSGTQTTLVNSGLGYPSAIAVDSLGDVFVADWSNNRVLELPVSGGQISIGSNLAYARGVAVDASGDVFIADQNHNQVVEVPGTSNGPGTGAQVTVASGLAAPYSVVVDGQGNLFIVDVGTSSNVGNVTEIPRANSVIFTVSTGVNLGTPVIFTEGVPSKSLANPDFTLVSSGTTCTGAVSTGTCTVSVQFTPQYAGLRRGAVKLVDNMGNVLATSYISGTGSGSLPVLSSSQKIVYGVGSPHGVAVDGAGNVFLADATANQVFKIAPGGAPTALQLGTNLNQPYALALDGAGNLYIADAGNNRVLELPYGATTANALNLTGLNYPEGLAIDGFGNLFIANTRATANTGAGTILELAAASGVQTTVVGNGLAWPSAVAVDAWGDLFIADWANNRVLEVTASGSQISIGNNLAYARGVAVDAAGDVFIADQNHNQVVEVPGSPSGPGTGTQITVASGLPGPYTVALDGQGDLFIVNVGTSSAVGNVTEIPRLGTSQLQTISFAAISTQTLGTALALTGSASSGLPVTFTSATPAVCTVSGSTAQLTGYGICTIVASQSGSAVYGPAVPLSQSFTVTGSGQTLGVNFTVPAGVTLGAPVVFTEGAPSSLISNPDFTLASSGTTCTSSATGTCTVSVQFNPQYPGLRRGAVKLVDNNNNVLATSYVSGIGSGSLVSLVPSSQKTVYSSGYPHGAAIDGAGNAFVVDVVTNQVLKITPSGTSTTLSLGTTLNQPYALALDGAGNLYIADSGNNRVLELPYGSSTATALNLSGMVYPEGLAVDGSGNLFIANTRAVASTGAGTLIKLAAGTGVQTTVVGNGLGYPSAVAVDAAGNLFVADWANNRVLEIGVSGAQLSIGSNLAYARGVAVDALGDVFIADQNHNQIVEVPGTTSGPGTGTQVTVTSGLPGPYNVTLDGPGNLYIVNVGTANGTGSVLEIPR